MSEKIEDWLKELKTNPKEMFKLLTPVAIFVFNYLYFCYEAGYCNYFGIDLRNINLFKNSLFYLLFYNLMLLLGMSSIYFLLYISLPNRIQEKLLSIFTSFIIFCFIFTIYIDSTGIYGEFVFSSFNNIFKYGLFILLVYILFILPFLLIMAAYYLSMFKKWLIEKIRNNKKFCKSKYGKWLFEKKASNINQNKSIQRNIKFNYLFGVGLIISSIVAFCFFVSNEGKNKAMHMDEFKTIDLKYVVLYENYDNYIVVPGEFSFKNNDITVSVDDWLKEKFADEKHVKSIDDLLKYHSLNDKLFDDEDNFKLYISKYYKNRKSIIKKEDAEIIKMKYIKYDN